MACIVFISGSEAGRAVLLPPGGLTFGRAADNDVRLDDELASRNHFSIRYVDGHWVLYDGRTPNGTFVDGIARIEYILKGGERIKVGNTTLLFLLSEVPPDSLPTIIEDEADRSRNLVTLRADYTVREEGSVYYRNKSNALSDILRTLNTYSDVEELHTRILDVAFERTLAHRGAILMNGPRISPDPKDFTSRMSRDRDYAGPVDFPLSGRVFEEVYATKNPYLTNNLTPIICAPILWGGIRGVIYLEGANERGAFEPEDLQFLVNLADAAALGDRLSKRVQSSDEEIDLLKAARTYKFEMKGESEAMQRLQRDIKKVAADDTASVLIMGETGTGKEGVARAIHALSARANKPLITFNCANAFEASLVQSEFFGHVKGAYTGATEARKGKLLDANGGTLFLDEIGDFPLPLQQALLRVLQEQEFEHVGSGKPIKVNVRMIAATKVDLEQAMSNGTFRDDLFYRLADKVIIVPPLRERREDIPLLAEHFLRMYGAHRPNISIAPKVMDALISYNWPGNIRELQKAIRGAIIDVETDVIELENIPERILGKSPATLNETARKAAEQARINRIRASLAIGKSVSTIAREEGTSESYIYRLLRQGK
jgi:transcriptional regulator with GAF, ATPase, and Fis domain